MNKLTLKQHTFVKRFIENKGNGTQAAMDSYDVKNYNTAHAIASENLQKPTIIEAIDEALRSQGLSLSVITSNLGEIANSKPEKISGDTVLKANVELLKLHGAYPNSKTSTQVSYTSERRAWFSSLSYEDAKKELAKLRAETAELIADSES